METEIVNFWRQKTKFNFAWYKFSSAQNLTITQTSKSSMNLTNTLHNAIQLFPERFGKPLKIVYVNKKFGAAWGFQKHLNGCPELKSRCVYTADRSQYRDADVLLFHMRDSFQLPRHRPPFQKWVLALKESPMHTYVNFDKHRWLFNITMTYKRSSDVPWEYGHCYAKNEMEVHTNNPERNLAAGKKHLIGWFVTNCGAHSRRQRYVHELMKHINVHKYGCGDKYSCPKSKKNLCDKMLNTSYKFYLSFENSLCEDYVTEKTFRILALNVVPVVLGHSNYSDMLPPHSFIDVRDYESPKELADYLTMLSKNCTLYNEYFRWRKTYTCKDNRANGACRLCEFTLQELHRIRTVDIKQFWSRETNCISPHQYYHGVNIR